MILRRVQNLFWGFGVGKLRMGLLLAICALLSACGGGGGSDSDDGTSKFVS